MKTAIALAVLLLACAHEPQLQPVPAADVAVRDSAAIQQVAGVRVEAVGRWDGDPADLPKILAPVRVTIDNDSGRALRVRYQDFALLGDGGFRYAALPPLQIGQAVGAARSAPAFRLAEAHVTAPVRPRFAHRGFFVAPRYHHMYPGFAPWPYGAWAYDPLYYDRWYGSWPRTLPTQDMIEQALPEGAVAEGGSISGYVYFQMPEGREPQVTFEMTLVDAQNGEAFGTVRIPFAQK